MSTNCLINFDHPQAIYNNGNTLNGHVKFEIGKIMSIRGISIIILGYGKVFWKESIDKTINYYTAYHQYLNSVTYVVGSSTGEPFDFAPGTYEYTFGCELPIQLPTSISEEVCKIKYKVIVTIDRHLRFNNVFQKEFTVHHTTDLNLMTIERMPRKSVGILQINPVFSVCCNDVGVIKAELEVPCDGFIPGQHIPFKLIIFNDSTSHIKETVVELIKCYTLKSTKPYEKTKEFTKEVTKKIFPNVPQHTNKEFIDHFDLPYLPPSHITKYISLEYNVIAKISGGYMKNLNVKIPVTIGTIPLDVFDRNELITVPPKPHDNTIGSVVRMTYRKFLNGEW